MSRAEILAVSKEVFTSDDYYHTSQAEEYLKGMIHSTMEGQLMDIWEETCNFRSDLLPNLKTFRVDVTNLLRLQRRPPPSPRLELLYGQLLVL